MQEAQAKVKILGAPAMKAKMKRIAYEIYERSYGSEELLMLSIGKRGGFVAEQLCAMVQEISAINVSHLNAAKIENGDGIVLDPDTASKMIAGKNVIVVDDVLYSGRTMFQAVASVMTYNPTKVQTAVLIDRGHRNVPVTHDYVGMVLATSLKQYVSVEVAENEQKAIAYLF